MTNYVYDAKITASDVQRLFGFMELELSFYNTVVDVFSPQFFRDHTLFLSMDNDVVNMYGQMCKTYPPVDITVTSTKLPSKFKKYIPTIQKLSSMQKFILSNSVRKVQYIDDTKRRIGMSILRFFIKQAEIRERNSAVNAMGDITIKAPIDTLSTQSSFSKKHIQVSRYECKVEKKDNNTLIYTPFTSQPIIVNDASVYHKKWNYIIIKQKDKIRLTSGDWCVILRNVDQDTYFYNMIDRAGNSSIVELTKSRT